MSQEPSATLPLLLPNPHSPTAALHRCWLIVYSTIFFLCFFFGGGGGHTGGPTSNSRKIKNDRKRNILELSVCGGWMHHCIVAHVSHLKHLKCKWNLWGRNFQAVRALNGSIVQLQRWWHKYNFWLSRLSKCPVYLAGRKQSTSAPSIWTKFSCCLVVFGECNILRVGKHLESADLCQASHFSI